MGVWIKNAYEKTEGITQKTYFLGEGESPPQSNINLFSSFEWGIENGKSKISIKSYHCRVFFNFFATWLEQRKGDSTITLHNFCRESMDVLLLKCWNDDLAYSELFEALANIE